jgi:branched-chain amino acid transport system ATP-binding protein
VRMPLRVRREVAVGGDEVPTAPGLHVVSLSAWYGQVRAIREVSLRVAPGEITGVLGRNGAGKSTLLRSIARVHNGAGGVVALNGRNLMGLRPDQAVAAGVSLVREGGAVFPNLTVEEHLQLGHRVGEIRGRSRDTAEVAEWFPQLWQLRGVRGGYLSGGQRQMLALATAFLGAPTCLLLDEPSAGLAESVAESMYSSIRRIAGSDVALLIAEQDSRWLTGLAERAYVLELGSLVRETTPGEVGGGELSWTEEHQEEVTG